MLTSTTSRLFLLFMVFVTGLLLSPKWFSVAAIWLHLPAALLLFRTSGWKWWLAGYGTLVVATVIAQLQVFPLPLPALVTFMLVGNAVGLLPFLLDRVAQTRVPAWTRTLVFPVVATALDLFMANGPQGTWGNNAYTQFNFAPLMQLAAVTGIFGINFLYYWFAAIVADLFTTQQPSRAWRAFAGTFVVVIAGGSLRLLTTAAPAAAPTNLAAINLSNDEVYESMYAAAFGQTLELSDDMDYSDPVLIEAQRGMDSFMTAPLSAQFAPVHASIDQLHANYANATRRAAAAGAKIVTWSEAAIITVKEREDAFLRQAAELADETNTYLFYPIAAFHTDKYNKAPQFMENKVLTFGPDGTLLNTYFKNIPVFGVEPSFPGDGTIPIIETPYGKLSPIICYDADHPQLIAQVSDTEAGLLVVPTGDWEAIAPYHTYMAAVRCIENGVSMLKATNHGTSALIDANGRIVEKARVGNGQAEDILQGSLAIGSLNTPYRATAPIFATLVQLSFLGVIGFLLFGWVRLLVRRLRSGEAITQEEEIEEELVTEVHA